MNIIKELLFFIVYTIHTGAWIFILVGGFFNKQYAFWIVYYIVPLMYILQMFQEHPFESMKVALLKEEKEKRDNLYHPYFILPVVQKHLSENVFKNSVFNPVSYQGLMILAMIMNVRIILEKCNNIIN